MEEQWRSMNDTLTEVKKQSFSAKESAEAAKIAADAANLSVRVAYAANVHFEEVMLIPDFRRHSIEVNFTNFGKLTAEKFMVELDVARVSLPRRSTIRREHFRLEGRIEILGSFGRFRRTIPITGSSPEDEKLLMDTKEALEISGSFRYTDELKTPGIGKFCTEYANINYEQEGFGSRSNLSHRGWFPCDDVPRLLESAKLP
jgi:hypothetical protein